MYLIFASFTWPINRKHQINNHVICKTYLGLKWSILISKENFRSEESFLPQDVTTFSLKGSLMLFYFLCFPVICFVCSFGIILRSTGSHNILTNFCITGLRPVYKQKSLTDVWRRLLYSCLRAYKPLHIIYYL